MSEEAKNEIAVIELLISEVEKETRENICSHYALLLSSGLVLVGQFIPKKFCSVDHQQITIWAWIEVKIPSDEGTVHMDTKQTVTLRSDAILAWSKLEVPETKE